MKKKKVVLSAGGTGGHLFPAQALAEELIHCDLLFMAGGLRSSSFFEKNLFAFEEIDSATFSLKRPLSMFKAINGIFRGIKQSRRLLRSFKPDLVVGFGSYHTLPVLLAALFLRIPIIIHEQNAIPGKVNRFLSSWAKITAITFPESAGLLKGNVQEAAFPLRKKKSKPLTPSWHYFGLEPNKLTILMFGGSQGAARLNAIFLEAIESMQKRGLTFQVLHFTGRHTPFSPIQDFYRDKGIQACVKTFEPRMDIAYAIADLAVTRAGASTIAELIEWEVPALLVPFPYARDNHQMKNAEHFVKCAQGGLCLPEIALNGDALAEAIQKISEKERMEKKKNIQQYKHKIHLNSLSNLIMEYIDGRTI